MLGFSVSSALGGMPLFGPAVVPVRVLADSYGYFMYYETWLTLASDPNC